MFAGVPEPLPVGSVKSNVGHPEAASGVAQLTKVALQLRHGELAPLVGTGEPNPHLALDGGPLVLCEELTPWPERRDAQGRRVARRALINSVAAGGSHVSLVVEAPPPQSVAETPDTTAAGPQLVVVSARDRARLRGAVRRLEEYLGSSGTAAADLADVAYTLQVGREPMPERFAVVADGVEELRGALAGYLAAPDGSGSPDTAPVYTGSAADGGAGPLLTMLDGAPGAAFLSALVADGDLARIAELWVNGARIPWRRLHPRSRRLLSLPGTAFERGSYWLGSTGATAHTGPSSASAPEPGCPDAPEPAAAATVPGPAVPEPAAAGPGTAASLRREPEAAERAEGTEGQKTAEREGVVLETCAELLGFRPEDLGPADSFLALGGHSLLAHRFAALLRDRGLHCDPPGILRARSLAAIAEAAEAAPVSTTSPAAPTSPPAPRPPRPLPPPLRPPGPPPRPPRPPRLSPPHRRPLASRLPRSRWCP